MTRVTLAVLVCALGAALAIVGCMDRQPAAVCPVPTELNETDAMIGGYEGVDMLVVVDNSQSMQEEQEILATAFFPLVNALVNPLPSWGHPAADDVRVAIVSSDMGLQWGGHPYEDGDGWPNDQLPGGCGQIGDNGGFQTYGSGKAIDIQHDAIPCDASADQCPTGWTCSASEPNEIGLCQAPDGDGTNQECPGMNATWAETPIWPEDAPVENDDLAFQVACMSSLGTDGCGFEQQLQAAAVGLNRDDQQQFLRDDYLLAVLVVSDEEDCSIESNGLFGEPEIQNMSTGEINVVCGRHPEHLYATAGYKTTFDNAKEGKQNAVVFAAIVGVPAGDGAQLSACEGPGHTIGNCLDHSDMQLEEVLEGETTQATFFAPACERYEDDLLITKARPGRRYVELAQEFENMGYMYSICRENWSPAMEDIAELIAEKLSGTCYPKPLDWDPVSKQAKCDVVAEYVDLESCPFDVPDDKEVVEEEFTDGEDVTHRRIFCPLPRLEAERECSDNDFGQLNGEFGWYYCENKDAENFEEACDDGLNNDPHEDDLVDCADPGCDPCEVCGGTGVGCENTCKYVVQLTDQAKTQVQGQNVSVQCLQQFSFTDPNCQENTMESCNNNDDEDGNGIWDCDADFEGDKPHAADPNCCPMEVDADGRCVVKSHGNCDGSSDEDPSDACRAHAELLGCAAPWNA